MKDNELDLFQYLRAVQVNVPAMIALIAALIAAAPAAATAALVRALASLGAAGRALEVALRARQFAEAAADPRPFDVALDRAWSALVLRLQAWGQLPAGAYPEQARAARLVAVLAPDGLAILKLPYREQWAQIKARLAEVSAQGLDGEMTELAGGAFVEQVRARFDDYGRVLGLTQPLAEPSQVNQMELLRAAQQRVTEYVIQVLATVDPERPETAQAARAALRPLTEARDAALAARKPDAKPDAPQPDAPQPDAPPARPSVPPVS